MNFLVVLVLLLPAIGACYLSEHSLVEKFINKTKLSERTKMKLYNQIFLEKSTKNLSNFSPLKA